MGQAVPIYRSHEETYHADTCGPLREAAAKAEIELEALVHGHYPGRQLPPEALPRLKAVGYWDAVRDQNWGLPWHRNEGVEITFVETGQLSFAVDGDAYALQPDDITITRPWQRHRVGGPNVGAGRLHWLILDLGVRRPNQEWKWPSWLVLSRADTVELTNRLRHNEHPVWRGTAEIRGCFQEIARAVARDRDGSHVSRLAVRINELFVLLLELLRREQGTLDASLAGTLRTVELFLGDLRHHPQHQAIDWTVGEMAASCGLGVTQFVEYVKRLTNLTPARYLNHCRLETASRLLREQPGLSVTEVALSCGFSSSQYFATAFARRYGHAPRAHRVATATAG